MHYYLSSPFFTLKRFEDGKFGDFWSGLWYCDFKVLNYFAVETAYGWTHYTNHVSFDLQGAMHEYDVNGCRVFEIERVDDSFTLRVEPEPVNFELGFAMHPVTRDFFVCPPTVSGNVVSAENHSFELIVDGECAVPKKVFVREHDQGGKRTKSLVVTLRGGNELVIRPLHPKRFFRRIQLAKRGKGVKRRAVDAVRLLEKRRGWYAGLPWFLQYWGRDIFWSVDGLLSVYPPGVVERTLLEFLLKTDDGEVPRLITERGLPEYGAWDTNPLLILALFRLARKKRSLSFIREYRQEIMDVFYFFESVSDDFVVKHVGGRSWMDSIRRKYAIEIQALWYAAALELERIGYISGVSDEIKSAFESKKHAFLEEMSANVLVAGILGLMSPEEAWRYARTWKLDAYGIRTVSPDAMEYDRGYHTGAAWGLTTGWGVKCACLAGDFESARRLFKILASRVDECWDPETGRQMGADVQLFTVCSLLSVLDSKDAKKLGG